MHPFIEVDEVARIESDAKETLMKQYSSREASTLKVTVSKDKATHDFPLKSPK